MLFSEERMKILTKIQEGKISSEAGKQLLDALDENSIHTSKSRSQERSHPAKGGKARFLHIRATEENTGKTNSDLRLPINTVNNFIKIAALFFPLKKVPNWEILISHIRSRRIGQILNTYDDEKGVRLEIFTE